jgi:hypothetical protein
MDSDADDLGTVLDVDVQRRSISLAELRRDQQNMLPPDSVTKEAEQLLDINGLLEISQVHKQRWKRGSAAKF